MRKIENGGPERNSRTASPVPALLEHVEVENYYDEKIVSLVDKGVAATTHEIRDIALLDVKDQQDAIENLITHIHEGAKDVRRACDNAIEEKKDMEVCLENYKKLHYKIDDILSSGTIASISNANGILKREKEIQDNTIKAQTIAIQELENRISNYENIFRTFTVRLKELEDQKASLDGEIAELKKKNEDSKEKFKLMVEMAAKSKRADTAENYVTAGVLTAAIIALIRKVTG